MEPASSIISSLGGASEVAKILGIHRTRPWNWTRPKSLGGTGGVVPFQHVPKLISAARDAGVELSAEDFLPAQTPEGAA
ncbi:helix-turn-helix domain-containing protein [Paracoccus sp. DMF]|nr:helix-turn-helix domain-containing protein [Paracoccus sp. DMF]